jgi:hypothetical protein
MTTDIPRRPNLVAMGATTHGGLRSSNELPLATVGGRLVSAIRRCSCPWMCEQANVGRRACWCHYR